MSELTYRLKALLAGWVKKDSGIAIRLKRNEKKQCQRVVKTSQQCCHIEEIDLHDIVAFEVTDGSPWHEDARLLCHPF